MLNQYNNISIKIKTKCVFNENNGEHHNTILNIAGPSFPEITLLFYKDVGNNVFYLFQCDLIRNSRQSIIPHTYIFEH